MTIRERLARREAIRTELRTIHAAHPSGELPADAQASWATLETEARGLDAAIARQALIDEGDRAAPAQPLDGEDRRLAELRNSVTLHDVIRAQLPETAGSAGAGRARELSQEMARRSGRTPQGLLFDMRTPAPGAEHRVTTTGIQGTAPIGAPLIATNLRADLLIDRLRNGLVVRRLGARIVSDLVGNIDVPRRTGSVTSSWVGENQSIPATDAAWDKVSLRPKTCGALTELSRNQVLQSSPDIEALTRDDMAKVLAEALDSAALMGGGDGIIPLGIAPQAANRPTYPKANAAPAWTDVLAMMSALDIANVKPTGWVEGPGMRSTLMGTPKSANLSLGFIQETPDQLAGMPATPSNLLPAGSLLLGDFTDVLIGFWSELDILVNPYADSVFAKGNIQVRAMMTCDVALRHPASFAFLQHATS